jgi:hypothetical protein
MNHKEQKQQAILEISKSYFILLTTLKELNDSLIMQGLTEGLNKFLSNAYIFKMGRNKHLIADFYSKNALEIIGRKENKGLVFEHMIPKDRFQKECLKRAENNELTLEYIVNELNRYWHIAIITKEEDALLSKTRKMPDSWDNVEIHARYKLINLELIEYNFH